MCRVVLTDDDGMYRSCYASNETPNEIFKYYRINSKTKDIYMNGELLTKEEMRKTLPEIGVVRFAIRDKTIKK